MWEGFGSVVLFEFGFSLVLLKYVTITSRRRQVSGRAHPLPQAHDLGEGRGALRAGVVGGGRGGTGIRPAEDHAGGVPASAGGEVRQEGRGKSLQFFSGGGSRREEWRNSLFFLSVRREAAEVERGGQKCGVVVVLQQEFSGGRGGQRTSAVIWTLLRFERFFFTRGLAVRRFGVAMS